MPCTYAGTFWWRFVRGLSPTIRSTQVVSPRKHVIQCDICGWIHSRLICSWGSDRFHSLWFLLGTLANMFFSVQLILWTIPLLTRWYGVVHLLSTPNMLVKFWKILLVKSCPLVCVCKCCITPKHDTHSLMSLLVTVAVLWSAVA